MRAAFPSLRITADAFLSRLMFSAKLELTMTITIKRAVVLVEQNAHIHREVLNLIDAGELKIILRGEDITDIERVRIENNLGRELQIIEAFGGHSD